MSRYYELRLARVSSFLNSTLAIWLKSDLRIFISRKLGIRLGHSSSTFYSRSQCLTTVSGILLEWEISGFLGLPARFLGNFTNFGNFGNFTEWNKVGGLFIFVHDYLSEVTIPIALIVWSLIIGSIVEFQDKLIKAT